MFTLGYQEMALVGLVALIVLGPERIPGVLRKIGEYSAILRRYTEDVKRQMELAEQASLGQASLGQASPGQASLDADAKARDASSSRMTPQDFAKHDVSSLSSSASSSTVSTGSINDGDTVITKRTCDGDASKKA